jgi:hypothetical protein
VTSPRITWDISFGSILHVIAMIALLITSYVRLDTRIAVLEGRFREVERSTIRIEHYLSSKDPNYWRDANQNGDDGGGRD